MLLDGTTEFELRSSPENESLAAFGWAHRAHGWEIQVKSPHVDEGSHPHRAVTHTPGIPESTHI